MTQIATFLKNEPQIRTWDDLAEAGKAKRVYSIVANREGLSSTFSGSPVERKALAMLKIAQLIDVAYGGLVSSQEQIWGRSRFYFIEADKARLGVSVCSGTIVPDILAFRTKEQAKDFLKYNEDLIKDYYML